MSLPSQTPAKQLIKLPSPSVMYRIDSAAQSIVDMQMILLDHHFVAFGQQFQGEFLDRMISRHAGVRVKFKKLGPYQTAKPSILAEYYNFRNHGHMARLLALQWVWSAIVVKKSSIGEPSVYGTVSRIIVVRQFLVYGFLILMIISVQCCSATTITIF